MKLWRLRILLAFFIALSGALINLTPQGVGIEEQFGLYWLFHMRGARPAPAEVVVVSIDQASAAHLNLPLKPSRWPRTLHAHLVDTLVRENTAVVAFDLVFDTPSNDAEQDLQFATAIERARRVVLVERLDFEEIQLSDDTAANDQSHTRIMQEGVGEIVPVIAEAARAHAPFPLPKSSWVNQCWTFRPSAGDMPTLPAIVLQLFALQVYDDFLRLLANVNPVLVGQLPRNAHDLDIENLVLDLRDMFMHNPMLAHTMLNQAARDSSLDTVQRRIIQALVNLYSGSEVRYLNFYGPPRTIRTIPYHLLIGNEADRLMDPSQMDFSEKIVFVGFSAGTVSEQDQVRDDYHTVFSLPDGLTLSGVEIVATALANLLENEAIHPVSPVHGAMILFLLGMVVCLLCFIVPSNNTVVYVLGIMLVGGISVISYGYSAVWLFGEMQVWLPLAIPLMIQLPVGAIGITTLLYFEANRERKRIEALFGGHRPEPVVRDVVHGAGPMHTDGQLVYGACLATDAEKYTTLAETMDPRQLALLMHDYYASIFEPVERHQGKVSDVIGDAMLAIWAATSADQALRERACLACLDIVEAVERFNRSGNGRPQLPTRIGLHFGEMVLGNIGARQHYEYRAVGDIVNTANRIQGVNKYLGTRLLVSEEVVRGLDGLLLRPLGRFLLPGKSQSIRLFELIVHKEESSEAQRWLCTSFERALRAYEAGDWADASHQLKEIQEIFPEDGPTGFLLARCQTSQRTPSYQSREAVISMQSK